MKKNAYGLTFDRWLRAAGYADKRLSSRLERELHDSWKRGEDPSDWRGDTTPSYNSKGSKASNDPSPRKRARRAKRVRPSKGGPAPRSLAMFKREVTALLKVGHRIRPARAKVLLTKWHRYVKLRWAQGRPPCAVSDHLAKFEREKVVLPRRDCSEARDPSNAKKAAREAHWNSRSPQSKLRSLQARLREARALVALDGANYPFQGPPGMDTIGDYVRHLEERILSLGGRPGKIARHPCRRARTK